MLQKISGIIPYLLVLAVISVGLPQFMAEDLNRDREIDLADAIIGMKGFVETADQPSTFTASVKNAVSAIHLVAGLETKIKSDSDKNVSLSLDQSFLVSETASLPDFQIFSRLAEIPTEFHSTTHLPQIPPPRTFVI